MSGIEEVDMYDLGDEIDIYCIYCKLNLNGIVSAVVEGEVKKVRCKTCGHFQDYRPPKDMQKAKERALKRILKARAKKSGQKQVKTEQREENLSQAKVLRDMWEKETEDANFRNTKVYDPYRTYEVGDFVAHKHFGLGKVMEINDGVMRVLFRDSIQQLEFGKERDEYEE